ncbi:MAG: RAMP superfamily CRISPR-associated protein [Wenzhouxiangellaceae bacterium]
MSSSLPTLDPGARYPRARLRFRLMVMSPLHVGSGEVEPLQSRLAACPSRERCDQLEKALADAGDYRLMALKQTDPSGQRRPYIPGPALKGMLRAELSASLGEADDLVQELFGVVEAIPEAERGRDGPSHRRRQGHCRFLDSEAASIADFGLRRPPLWHEQRGTLVRSRVSINPITGAARDHHLAFHEMLPAGSTLGFTIEAREISGAALSALASRLLAATAEAPLRIGAGAALGCGELRLLTADNQPSLQLEVITAEALLQWLRQPLSPSAPEPLSNLYRPMAPVAGAQTGADGAPAVHGMALEFETQAPLLVASGLDRTERDKNNQPKPAVWHEDPPQFSPLMSADQHIIIPAGSLRGLIRARCRRILIVWLRELWTRNPRTRPPVEDTAQTQEAIDDPAVAANQAGEQADRLLPLLFGSTHQASPLRISDALSVQTFKPDQLHHQSFIAVDRFTGSVADGALYQAWATPVGCRFKASIRLRPGAELPDWGLLLLALLARDGFAGDLQIGWGKAKGYGRLLLTRVGEYHQANASHEQPLPDRLSALLPDEHTLYQSLASDLGVTEPLAEENSA